MRITRIDIKDFRAFYGEYSINLHKAGKNLLIYGENGSGKSSLFLALKLFLQSQNLNFENYRNIFVRDADEGYLKLFLRQDGKSSERTYEWSKSACETNDTLILDAGKTSGFIDYKRLLEIYFLNV